MRLLHRVLLALLATACTTDPTTPVRRAGDRAAPPAAEILSCVDLPRGDRRSHNLSGLAWDPAERRLYALSDRDRTITVLIPRPGFAGVDLGPSIDLAIDVTEWDGEALAIMGDRFLVVANETEPAVFTVDRTGGDARRFPLPGFTGIRDNVGLEGIGYVPSRRGGYVFAVNEEALIHDGPMSTTTGGTVVRILRHRVDGAGDLEVAYLTDPIFADGAPSDNGVSDLAALSADRVLVVERAWVRGRGNAIRVYAVDLRGAPDIAALPDARAATPVAKRLVFDLAALPDDHCPPSPGPQRRRTLENTEGMALGPTLDDGRRVVFLVSDDNDNTIQAARLITVAVSPGALEPPP